MALMEFREDLRVLKCNFPLCERVPSKTAGCGHRHPVLTFTLSWLGAHSKAAPDEKVLPC